MTGVDFGGVGPSESTVRDGVSTASSAKSGTDSDNSTLFGADSAMTLADCAVPSALLVILIESGATSFTTWRLVTMRLGVTKKPVPISVPSWVAPMISTTPASSSAFRLVGCCVGGDPGGGGNCTRSGGGDRKST